MSILDLLAKSYDTEGDYYAKNPWSQAGRSISGIKTAPTTTAEALWMPILQGLAAGTFAGIGKDQVDEAAFQEAKNNQNLAGTGAFDVGANTDFMQNQAIVAADPLAAMLSGDYAAAAEPPVAYNPLHDYTLAEHPEGYTPQIKNQDLLAALAQQEQSQQKDLIQKKADADLQAAINLEDVKNGGWYNKLSVDEKTKLNSVQGTTKEFLNLASELKELKSPAPVFQTKRYISGTRENLLSSRMENMVVTLRKLAGDTANAGEREQLMTLAATLGNITSGSQGAAERIEDAAHAFQRIAYGQLASARKGILSGGDALMRDIETSLGPQATGQKQYKASDLQAQGYVKGPTGWVKPKIPMNAGGTPYG